MRVSTSRRLHAKSIPLVLLTMGCIGFQSPVKGQDSPWMNSQRAYDEITVAFYSDEPLVLLERIRDQLLESNLQYEPDRLESIREAEAFLQDMSESAQLRYLAEKEFRRSVRMDTLVSISEADLTGDGIDDELLARIFGEGSRIYLEYLMAAGTDTLSVTRLDATPFPDWSPFPELREGYPQAIAHAPSAGIRNAKDLFTTFPHEMAEHVAQISGRPGEDFVDTVTQYIENFRGMGVCVYDPVGPAGHCMVWYAPLQQFVVLYYP